MSIAVRTGAVHPVPGALTARAEKQLIEFNRAKERVDLQSERRFVTDNAKELMMEDRYADAEAMLRTALSLEPYNTAFRNMLMKAVARDGRMAEAQGIFDETLALALPDVYTFNMMMRECVRVKDLEGAKQVLEHAESWGLADDQSYEVIFGYHYHRGQYGQAMAAIERGAGGMENAGKLRLAHFELLRKTKRYEEAVRAIDNYLGEGQVVGKEKERTIRAYCLMELGRTDEAEAEFRSIERQLGDGSAMLPRVLCGIVFCGNVTREEAPQLRARLEWQLPRHRLRKIGAHIEKALAVLDAVPEMPELGIEACQ